MNNKEYIKQWNNAADYQAKYIEDRKTKRSDRICPNCGKRGCVDKCMRICKECNHRLLWNGDSIEPMIRLGHHFYMFYKGINGLQGWYDGSYFKRNVEAVKY